MHGPLPHPRRPATSQLRRRALRRSLTAAALSSVLLVSGCSGADEPEQPPPSSTVAEPSQEPTPEPSPTQTDAPGEPRPGAVTAPGTELSFGDTATVAYQSQPSSSPGTGTGTGTGRRADAAPSTRLDLTVRSAKQGALKDFGGFDLEDPVKRKANYYYVRVSVENAGKKAVTGDVPLWGVSGENTLLPPVRFTAPFPRCPTESLPKSFKPGADFTTCLVFLSPDRGSLEGISYRPETTYDPIQWQGKVDLLKKKAKKATKKSGKASSNR